MTEAVEPHVTIVIRSEDSAVARQRRIFDAVVAEPMCQGVFCCSEFFDTQLGGC